MRIHIHTNAQERRRHTWRACQTHTHDTGPCKDLAKIMSKKREVILIITESYLKSCFKTKWFCEVQSHSCKSCHIATFVAPSHSQLQVVPHCHVCGAQSFTVASRATLPRLWRPVIHSCKSCHIATFVAPSHSQLQVVPHCHVCGAQSFTVASRATLPRLWRPVIHSCKSCHIATFVAPSHSQLQVVPHCHVCGAQSFTVASRATLPRLWRPVIHSCKSCHIATFVAPSHSQLQVVPHCHVCGAHVHASGLIKAVATPPDPEFGPSVFFLKKLTMGCFRCCPLCFDPRYAGDSDTDCFTDTPSLLAPEPPGSWSHTSPLRDTSLCCREIRFASTPLPLPCCWTHNFKRSVHEFCYVNTPAATA